MCAPVTRVLLCALVMCLAPLTAPSLSIGKDGDEKPGGQEQANNGNGNANSNSNANSDSNSNANTNANENGNAAGEGKKDSPGKSSESGAPAPTSSAEVDQDLALEAVESNRAVPLETITEAIKATDAGEVIDAQLITVNNFLLYEVTVLSDTGKVSKIYYYARSGLRVGP